MPRFTRLTSLLLAIVLAAPLFAAPPPDGPTVVKMTVRAQATTRPALAIRLLPSLSDQTPGDAAPIYLLAATLWNRESNTADKEPPAGSIEKLGLDPKAESWSWSTMLMQAPLAKLKGSRELEEYLGQHQNVLEMLAIASVRESCNWDLPFREQGFRTLLPHLQALRSSARAVCVKARSQLAAGDVVAAMKTLRTNFAMVRALNQQAVLVQSLVGAAITASTLTVVREAAEIPGAPNLYWTLSDLPKPLFDLHVPMEWERSALFYSLPQLRKVREGTFSDADWRDVMKMMNEMMEQPGTPRKPGGVLEQLEMAGQTAVLYIQASRYLISRGMTEAEVDAMSKTAVLGKYMVDSFNEVYDEITKWTTLPYWQASQGLMKAEKDLRELLPKSNPLLLVVPSVHRAMFSLHRIDRDLAATQTAEALRDYAARNNGNLPRTLEEVTETPIPMDPVWGKPFTYKVEGQTATLESPAPEGMKKTDALRLTVTIKAAQ